MLNWLINKEETVKNIVRKSEEEVKSILNDRTHEETVTELTVSVYDTERNTKAKQYKLDLDKKTIEEKLRKQTLEVDYLAPFLAEFGLADSKSIPPHISIELKERCLADLKQHLIDKANLIQKRFEAVIIIFAMEKIYFNIHYVFVIGKQRNAKKTTMVSIKSDKYEQRRRTRIFRVLC